MVEEVVAAAVVASSLFIILETTKNSMAVLRPNKMDFIQEKRLESCVCSSTHIVKD